MNGAINYRRSAVDVLYKGLSRAVPRNMYIYKRASLTRREREREYLVREEGCPRVINHMERLFERLSGDMDVDGFFAERLEVAFFVVI